MAVRASAAIRNAALNGGSVAEIIDGDSGNGTIEYFTGAVHGTFGNPPGGTKIATVTLANPSFQAAASGSMTANTIQSDVSADANGTIGCFVLKSSDGDIQLDGSVTITGSGGDIQFASVSATAGDTIAMTSLIVSIPQT